MGRQPQGGLQRKNMEAQTSEKVYLGSGWHATERDRREEKGNHWNLIKAL